MRNMDTGSKSQVGRSARRTSPLRKNATQHEIYSAKAEAMGSTPYPRGPAMDENTNIHSGQVASHAIERYGPLNVDDEREMVQLLFDMIQQEKKVEEAKCNLVEFQDFNLMDGF
jgi:hypothetical protein